MHGHPVKFALKCSPGQKIEKRSEKVAIIGAGPAGLGAAGYLICRGGFQVDVYDKLPEPGGLMIFGIPDYRVPKKNVKAGIKELIELGVNFILRTKVVADEEVHADGDDFAENKVRLENLINNYNAVLIATGDLEIQGLGSTR